MRYTKLAANEANLDRFDQEAEQVEPLRARVSREQEHVVLEPAALAKEPIQQLQRAFVGGEILE